MGEIERISKEYRLKKLILFGLTYRFIKNKCNPFYSYFYQNYAHADYRTYY
ncbi:hypothetical protein ZORO111902_13910 [Zobellia roscoffensis]